jgi:hypothetical protein
VLEPVAMLHRYSPECVEGRNSATFACQGFSEVQRGRHHERVRISLRRAPPARLGEEDSVWSGTSGP